MPIQSAIAQVGLAKQTAKGSVAASPTFGHGITDGSVITVEVAQELEERTSGVRISPAVNRTGVMPGMEFTSRAHPKSLGLYLFGALGAVNTTGSNPYTHVITTSDDLPYLTGFGKLGANIYSVRDFKIDTVGISFSNANPVEVAVAGMGTVVGYPAGFNVVNNEDVANYFTSASGTFKLDTDSGTPVTASITAGEINIANALETIMLSGAITPDDVYPGRQDVECSFDLVIDNLNDWRTVLTGTSSGSNASVLPIYGSFEITFINGADSIKLESTKCAFTADFPDANPGGGPVSLSLAGLVVQNSSAEGLKATLINSHTSY